MIDGVDEGECKKKGSKNATLSLFLSRLSHLLCWLFSRHALFSLKLNFCFA